jgi:hypothetical protein
MKVIISIFTFIILATIGFSQTFIKIGNYKYELECDTAESGFHNSANYRISNCKTLNRISKEYFVKKYNHEVLIGYSSPSPPFGMTNFTSYWADSIIEVNSLVDSVTLSIDSLLKSKIKLVINNQEMEVVGCNLWAFGDSTLYTKVRADEGINELSNILWILQGTKYSYSTLIINGIYYMKKDDYYFLDFDWQCNIVENIR